MKRAPSFSALCVTLLLGGCGGDDEGSPGVAGGHSVAGTSGSASGAGGGSNGGSTAQGGGSSGSASQGGGSSSNAMQVALATTFETTAGDVAGLDTAYAEQFCGSPEDPSSLKPMGTIVRTDVSKRYFVCIGDYGARSVDLLLTNEPGDPVQGFVPYAALFTYDDPLNPNTDRPAKGNRNYALLSIAILDTQANSICSSSNGVFDDFRIGGAKAGLCSDVPTPYREADGKRYVDVTFPDGSQQSFELQPVPFEPL